MNPNLNFLWNLGEKTDGTIPIVMWIFEIWDWDRQWFLKYFLESKFLKK